jgi:hypothetical protein
MKILLMVLVITLQFSFSKEFKNGIKYNCKINYITDSVGYINSLSKEDKKRFNKRVTH